MPAPLSAFVEAVQRSQEQVLILDDFLFKPKKTHSAQARYDQILAWFPMRLVANDVRFLTNAHGNQAERDSIQRQFAKKAAEINNRSRRREGKVAIQIKFTLNDEFPYVHDRFAIVDNELWHFGSTVGGLHHDVSAATRGWDAKQHDACRFFEDAWRGDGDTIRNGRHG